MLQQHALFIIAEVRAPTVIYNTLPIQQTAATQVVSTFFVINTIH